jgi:hypothetical protein
MMTIPIYIQQNEAAQRKIWSQQEQKIRDQRFRKFIDRQQASENKDLPDNVSMTCQSTMVDPAVIFVSTMKGGFRAWFLKVVWNPILHFFHRNDDYDD